NKNVSVIPGSICARWAARISFVEIGSRPGLMRGPMMPPSITIVRFGAWRCCASAAASSGTPTPANTVVSSRSTREPMMAKSSADVNGWVIVMGAVRSAWTAGGLFSMRGGFVVTGAVRPAWTAGGLFWKRVAPVGRSLGQFSRLLLLFRQALAAEEVEVVVPRRRRVDIAGEVVGHRGLGPARVDRG